MVFKTDCTYGDVSTDSGRDVPNDYTSDESTENMQSTMTLVKSTCLHWPTFLQMLVFVWGIALFLFLVPRPQPQKSIYCMDEVLSIAVKLNTTYTEAQDWHESGFADKLMECTTKMAANMIPDCDDTYWSFFTRSISVLQAIDYALLHVPEGNSIRQWIFMDNCPIPPSSKKLNNNQQCEETMDYTACLERYAVSAGILTIRDDQFDDAELRGVSRYGGVPFLKLYVSYMKRNISRTFQDVICSCNYVTMIKVITKQPLYDIVYSIKLLALVYYVFIGICVTLVCLMFKEYFYYYILCLIQWITEVKPKRHCYSGVNTKTQPQFELNTPANSSFYRKVDIEINI